MNGELVAIAKHPGTSTLTFCDGVVSGEVEVLVAPVGAVLPALPEELAASRFLSNEDSFSLLVPLRALRWEGGRHEDGMEDFRSGAAAQQRLQLQCQPSEAGMQDFFDFKVVGREDESLVRASRFAEAGCLLQSKRPDAKRWTERLAPLEFSLEVSTAEGGAAGTVHRWPFIPQFGVMDAAGKQLADGEACARLTPDQSTSSVLVWTGGHGIEASLVGQIADSRRGNLSIMVEEDWMSSGRSKPSRRIWLRWNDAVVWGPPEEVSLRITSASSGQVETFQIRLEVKDCSGCAVVLPDGRSRLSELALLCLALALLWLLCSRPRHTAAAVPVSSAPPAFTGPFKGPDLASPFQPTGFRF